MKKLNNKHLDLSMNAKNQVNTILAQTDWQQYWLDVSEQSKPEIDAYEAAYARSMASAINKYIR